MLKTHKLIANLTTVLIKQVFAKTLSIYTLNVSRQLIKSNKMC